ncbi:transcriptional regulator, AlpA family [Fodinibius roseus]|uniref:Transcriptional regulator, AlpA family n=1 Tax=Fodinibius roseus TaxID=1194090 RepID=A0A1M4X385_9BACT|nr:AlpA family phage regulatory protein [Fodinibius roseus]SHE87919.1 transcriptional regulator, AlpA family [Fodinibius roseus]
MDNLIRPKVLSNKLGIGLSTLYELMKEPDFPRKVRISKQAVGFRESEIMEWIESNTEDRDDPQSPNI